MDNIFTETLNRWHDFYGLADGVSTTLFGLLFVGVSIHIDLIASEAAKMLRQVAGQILFNFVYVIVIALTVASPIVSKELLALVLLVVGIMGVVSRAGNVIRTDRNWL